MRGTQPRVQVILQGATTTDGSGNQRIEKGRQGRQARNDQVHTRFADDAGHQDVGGGGGEDGGVVGLDDVGAVGACDEGTTWALVLSLIW